MLINMCVLDGAFCCDNLCMCVCVKISSLTCLRPVFSQEGVFVLDGALYSGGSGQLSV